MTQEMNQEIGQEIRKTVEKVRKIRQLSLSAFPAGDPGHRRHVRAPMCIR
jgi:(p)ppGpp synthase/HD superfamily hydrolase